MARTASLLVRVAVAVAGVVFVACGSGAINTPSPAATPQPQAAGGTTAALLAQPALKAFAVPKGSRPHDVAPAADGGIWYTAQSSGKLGWLNPENGEVREIPLGPGSAPHGVIVGPDGAPWITDGGQNAIVRVDPLTR